MNHENSSYLNIPKLLFLRSSGLTSPTTTKCHLSSWALGRLSQCHSRAVEHTTHSSSITAMDLDREEARYLVLGAGDGTLYIHDILNRSAESEALLQVGKSHRHCHRQSVVSVGWGEDSGMFTSTSRDGELRVWDTNRGATVEVFNLEMKINRHALQRGIGSATVAVAGDKSLVQLVDLRSGSLAHVLRGHTGGGVTSLAWAQGSLLASGGHSDRRVVIWDVRMAKSYLRYLDSNCVSSRSSRQHKPAGWSHKGPVQGLAWAQDGRQLVSLGQDRRLRRWDVGSGLNMKTRFPEIDSSDKLSTVDLEISSGRDGGLVFVPEETGVAMLDLTTGKRVKTLSGHFSKIYCLKYNPQQLELYTSGRDRFVHVWSPVESGDDINSESKQLTCDTWSDSD